MAQTSTKKKVKKTKTTKTTKTTKLGPRDKPIKKKERKTGH